MTTSIAYLRNAFTLFCVSLVIGIALTVDWILSNKYDCLFFCQSYDLLVVNMESLFLLNDRFKVTFYHLVYPWRLIRYFKNCKTIWKGQMVLRFASAQLAHFDLTTCTPVIRGKAVFLTGLLETIVLSHINGTVLWLLIILILANNYAFHLFPLLKIAQVNLDLVALFSAVFYFLYTGFAFGFTLLLVGFVSGRLMGSSLAYHWVAHRKIMTSVDRFNDDIIRLAAAAVMTYVTPYNIYLLTAIVFTKNTSSSSSSEEGNIESVDKGGLVISLTYQIVAISAIAAGLCVLIDRLHASAGDMHGLQLWLSSSLDRNSRPCDLINLDFLPVVSLHTKWKYLTHYELVHTNAKQFFTIGPLPLSKKSAFDFTLFYIAYVLFAADLFIGKNYIRKSYQVN
ncbi:hypothetical protein TYRP_013922 [Tyrophagus putrescentiae]|nr:hypothetical protein TYRP_013922 [Tyrophagus putrescentiae]